MLPKKHRLTTETFPLDTRPIRVLHSDIASLKMYSPLPQNTSKAVSIVVSKKVAKLSVRRSALRRRSYALFEAYFPTLPKAVYVLYLKKGAAECSKAEFREHIGALLEQV